MIEGIKEVVNGDAEIPSSFEVLYVLDSAEVTEFGDFKKESDREIDFAMAFMVWMIPKLDDDFDI